MRKTRFYAKSLSGDPWVTRRQSLKTIIERAKWYVDECAKNGKKVTVRVFIETSTLNDGNPYFDLESCYPVQKI